MPESDAVAKSGNTLANTSLFLLPSDPLFLMLPQTFCGISNTPGGIRTHDLRFRKPALYPAELRGQSV